MCEFHESTCNGFGDIWWTDNPIYFSSIDYVHISVGTCIHACMYVCIHACMHACMHTYIHTYMHTHIHQYMHTHTCTHLQRLCTHTHMYEKFT